MEISEMSDGGSPPVPVSGVSVTGVILGCSN
jgi:hypothetical protein